MEKIINHLVLSRGTIHSFISESVGVTEGDLRTILTRGRRPRVVDTSVRSCVTSVT